MFYLGIDIGKLHHEAGMTDNNGKRLGKSLRFSNTHAGFQALLSMIEDRKGLTEEADSTSVVGGTADYDLAAQGDLVIQDSPAAPDTPSRLTSDLSIGMEATGHYWLALYSFLLAQGFTVHVMNPLQSDSFRNFSVRPQKTDAIDCFLIADVMRFAQFQPTHLADEDILTLRTLARFRESLRDTCSNYKKRAVTILDQLFPEYSQLFSDLFGEASKACLRLYANPQKAAAANTKSLATLLKKASRNRLGTDKAREIKDVAARSVGITICSAAFELQLNLLLDQIDFANQQILQLESELDRLVRRIDSVLMTVPGVGPATGAVILGEIGDIQRFPKAKNLVAYAGLDPTIFQSGEYRGKNNHMSKRGSPYLRRAIWMSAVVASRVDPIFADYYAKKRADGAAHGTAIGAVARKLLHTIYAVLKANTPYRPAEPKCSAPPQVAAGQCTAQPQPTAAANHAAPPQNAQDTCTPHKVPILKKKSNKPGTQTRKPGEKVFFRAACLVPTSEAVNSLADSVTDSLAGAFVG